MNEHNKSLIYIQVSIFLFGFSALFAKLINQPPVVITFGRVFFSSVFLFALIKCNKLNLKLDMKKDYLLMIISGIMLAAHWFCFIQSIQVSTVAIGTITFSTFPLFVSFLEPVFFKEKIRIRTVICSLIMMTGVLIIARIDHNRESNRIIIGIFRRVPTGTRFPSGIIAGLVSSLTYAVLSLLNRYFSAKYKSEIIVFYEQATAAIVLLPFLFAVQIMITKNDLFLLALLGVIFTAVAHGLFIRGLRYVKVSTAGIISGLEAVYAIMLASVILREIPAINEVLGGLIVILTAGYMTLFREKKAS